MPTIVDMSFQENLENENKGFEYIEYIKNNKISFIEFILNGEVEISEKKKIYR